MIKSMIVTIEILPEQSAMTVIRSVVIVLLWGPLFLLLIAFWAVVTCYSFALSLIWVLCCNETISSSSSQPDETAKCRDEKKGQKEGQL